MLYIFIKCIVLLNDEIRKIVRYFSGKLSTLEVGSSSNTDKHNNRGTM